MAASNNAQIWAVIGASGTGKGVWAKGELKRLKPARFVAWDFMNEYQDHGKEVQTLDGIRTAMLKAGNGPLRVRYVPRGAGEKALRKEFETLCELVYAWGDCVFIAEELANVTTPGWAPSAWRKMSTSGRHAKVHIIGFTQTPALVDKTFLGNATLVHVCALRESNHRRYVAMAIDCPVEDVTALQKFEFIERNYDTGELKKGRVKVPGAAPTARAGKATATGGANAGQDTGEGTTFEPVTARTPAGQPTNPTPTRKHPK